MKLLGAGLAAGALPAMIPVAADTGSPERLQVEGNRITTSEGTPVTLRGLNTVDPKRADHTAADRGFDAVGMVDRITDGNAGWDPAVVRIPVQPTDIGDHERGQAPDPVAFTREQLETYLETHLDPVVKRCAERGVYAIVDFHRHWPGIEWGDRAAGTINQPLQDEAMLFWDVVAPRYAEEDHVIYEMYNEPTEPGMWGSPEEWWVKSVWYLYLEFAQPIVDTIRSHTDTLVLVGSPSWSQSPEGALIQPVDGENIAYTYHIYPGHESSQQRDWEDASINGEGVERVYEEFPLFVTEFGWRDTDDRWLGGTTSEFGEPFLRWLESSDAINWTAWCGDVWWEPKLFTEDGDDWALLGRDAGSLEDAGAYVRQALEAEGVPEGYWSADESGDDGSTDAQERLQVEGNRITTGEGTPVTLRGLNTVDPKRADHTAADRGFDAVGMVDRVTDSEAGWEPSVVRIPVQPTDIGDHERGQAPEPVAFTREQLESYLETHLDPVVQCCAERGVYAIVDFHRHWPGIEWGDRAAGTINQPLQDEAVLFWDVVAPRYAEEDHVIYEMYNEPTEPGMWGSPEESWVKSVWYLYLEFAQPIVDTIRSHTDTLVLVGSPSWSQTPEGALIEPVQGGNIAYTYHIYPGHESSQRKNWEDASINGEGVERVYEEFPLFVTEFGWRDTDDRWLGGTTSEFGEPFLEWLESSDAINWTAWCGDVWWEPALFTEDGDDWALLGRDAGTAEDAGEYVRQALATGGVPEDYWTADE